MERKENIRKIVIISVLSVLIVGLSFLPLNIGPLSITLTIIPIAVGAVLFGPIVGLILGFVFGLVSFFQCFGYSAFGVTLLGINPFLTFLVCIPTRMLAGFLPGLIYKGFEKAKLNKHVNQAIACLLVPLFNTIFFMSVLIICFYNTDFIKGLRDTIGSTNPFNFVILFVGINGLVELLAGAFISFPVSKALELAFPANNFSTVSETFEKDEENEEEDNK